jgi:ankyrin repeat protein
VRARDSFSGAQIVRRSQRPLSSVADELRKWKREQCTIDRAPPSTVNEAAHCAEFSAIRRLMKAHPEQINQRDEWGHTPLHAALMANPPHEFHPTHPSTWVPTMTYLVEHGADPRMTFYVPGEGVLDGVWDYTALHQAAFFGMVDFVRVLVEHGADVNARDSRGYTPFLQAMRCDFRFSSDEGASQVIEYLAARGADLSILGECETIKRQPAVNCPKTTEILTRLACSAR